MTPEERAKNLASVICDLLNVKPTSRQDADNFDAVVQEIAAAIREAVHETLMDEDPEFAKEHEQAHAEGFREGVEKAAELVRNSHGSLTAFGLADTIRELLPATEEK